VLKDWHWNPGILGLHEMTFYEVLFALSGVMRLLAAAVFLPRLHEPNAARTVEALRMMSSNIYNNLFNAILMPLRFLRVQKGESYSARRLPIRSDPPLRKAA
jgi:hypothetical protein